VPHLVDIEALCFYFAHHAEIFKLMLPIFCAFCSCLIAIEASECPFNTGI